MQFVNWTNLNTCAGVLAMNLIITQFTKDLRFIRKIPTQIWSYVVSLAVLYPAYLFTGQLSISNAVLILFNGMIVALAANGGFTALQRTFPKLFKGE